MSGTGTLSRRRLLLSAGAAGGGLLVGFALPPPPDRLIATSAANAADADTALNAWIRIAPDGGVTLISAYAEMGQGIYTGIATLLAEELDADWSRIRVEPAPVDSRYANLTIVRHALELDQRLPAFLLPPALWLTDTITGFIGIQITASSTSLRDAWGPLRTAGAATRAMLVAAAAERWQVPVADCDAADSHVRHAASGRRADYGELAAVAARLDPPDAPRLKPPSAYRLIGKPDLPRLDVPPKVDGSARFGIDVRLPDQLYATVRHVPAFGGTVKSFNGAAVADRPGVEAVLPVPGGVAVVANSYWQAKAALDELPVTFDDGPEASLSSDAILAQFTRALDEGDARTYRDDGDVDAALDGAAQRVAATYSVPYLAHACLEPVNCTARVTPDSCEVWAPNQAATFVQWAAAEVTGLPDERITVHSTLLGGGFGRKSEIDCVRQAITLAKHLDRPVQLVWSREEDMQHSMYRPAALARFEAGLDDRGMPVAWRNRLVSQSLALHYVRRIVGWELFDWQYKWKAEGAADLPYALANQRVEHVLSETAVPVGFWRGVGHSQNAFFTESFLDEIAAAAQQDPYALRRALLEGAPRYRRVIDAVAEKAGWGAPMAAGRGRGIALHKSFGSIVGLVAEVQVDPDGALTVERLVCAVDCGLAVNPDNVLAQLEGGLIFGLSATLYGAITIRDGRVEQENFPDYEMVRMADAPAIEAHILDSDDPPIGVGQVTTPVVAPAVANAVFAATGKRIRNLPLAGVDLTAG
jgi:isoquinoline 1-oxidoreductase beta subunit